MGEWRLIETAPRGESPVLASDDAGRMNVSRHWRGNLWYYAVTRGGAAILWRPTHWMPLPDPPAEDAHAH